MPDTREEAGNEARGKNEKETRPRREICKSHPLVMLKGDFNAPLTGPISYAESVPPDALRDYHPTSSLRIETLAFAT